MKKLFALFLALIILCFSGCNSYPFKYSKKDATVILKFKAKELTNLNLYNFSGNVLIIGEDKSEDQKKFIIYSLNDKKIIKEAVFNITTLDDYCVSENRIAVFEREKEKITFFDENLNEKFSCPFKEEPFKNYKIDPLTQSVYILDRTKGITKKSLKSGEETVIYSGSIEPFDYLEKDNHSFENELYRSFGDNNCIFFYTYNEKTYKSNSACLDTLDDSVSFCDIPILCDYAYKLGENIYYRASDKFYIVDNPPQRVYSESLRIKFVKNTDKFVSESKSQISLYDSNAVKLSTFSFDHLSNKIDDIIYIKELDSYLFAYTRPYKDSYFFLWKP